MINNFPMAAEQNSQLPEKGECMVEQNGWHHKHELESSSESSMDDDQLCENDGEADDKEEDYCDDENDGTIEDADPVLPVCLNIDGRIEHTQNFDAASSREDSMLVDSSEGDKLQGTVDFRQNSLSSEGEQVHGRTLDELLALYGQEGSLADDEDDNGWSPYGVFAVRKKWFCINCTMPNLDDALHCDLCGEYRESGILNEGYLSPQFAPAEVFSSSQLSLEMPAEQFAPDLTIISAGFDAAKGDPLGGCEVTPFGFAYMTKMLSDLFEGKLLVILEGGYNLRSISASATAVVKVLLGENMGFVTDDIKPSKSCLETLLEVLEIQSHYWPILNGNYVQLRTQWEALYPTKKDVQYLEVERVPVHSTSEEQILRSVSPDLS